MKNQLVTFLSAVSWPAVVAAAGKVFIEAAVTMPAPPASAGYFRSWTFDFIQTLAANKSRVGERKPMAIANPQPPSPSPLQ